ncbi:hypothetical protein DLH72_01690 [Candidatus Gracilibacteria bacterium]|nr:MAG: hypothetical protein DLH72_01690 [Candidatus Gracilibacteria bacterium]
MAIIKRTKRDETKILFTNVVYGFLIGVELLVLFFIILPNHHEVEAIKSEAFELNSNLEKYKSKGMPLEEIKSMIRDKKVELDPKANEKYILSIINEVDEGFYKNNFENSSGTLYDDFINKKVEIYKNDTSPTNEEKLKITSKVLPYYSDNVLDGSNLTDFQFINYVESIISTFNLSYTNPIGIKEIKQIDNYKLLSSDNSFDKGIYEIPVDLNISGRKSSIIDFLHFIENVGKVTFDNETKNISINKEESDPGTVFFDFRNKKLDGQKSTANGSYNIYDNQIADIELISMNKYIDSSEKNIRSNDDGKTFLKFLKFSQDKEKFDITVRINFYVKGVPKYKVDEFISSFNKRLSLIDDSVKKILGKTDLPSNQKQKFTNIKLSIENIKNSIKDNSSANGLMDRYQNISGYLDLIEGYENEIKKINN